MLNVAAANGDARELPTCADQNGSREAADVLLAFANPVLQPWAQPYGALIVRDAVCARGLRAEVVLPFLRTKPMEYLMEVLRERRPAIVGLSFRNLDTAGFRYDSDGEEDFLGSLRLLVNGARSHGGLVAIGGSGFSVAPAHVLEETQADIGFAGTSETEFAEFCWRILRTGADIEAASAGLKSVVLPGKPAPRRVALPVLGTNSSHPEAIEYARLTGATVPVRTKTGCSLRCTYCVVPWIEAQAYRQWTAIRDELRSIVKAGLGDAVFIADGEFNLPSAARAIDLCRRIADEFGDSLRWRCYLSEKEVTSELLDSMARAGCIAASISVDALTEETRLGFAKGSPVETAVRAVRSCLSTGLRTNVNMLFGGPNETWTTLAAGAARAAALHAEGALLSVTIGLRVYPGTPLAKQARLPRYRMWSRACRCVPWLGTFCSPGTPPEVAAKVLPILPPGPSITYTGALAETRTEIDTELAMGAVALANGRLNEARSIFARLHALHPGRLEPELGLLKTEYYSLVGSGVGTVTCDHGAGDGTRLQHNATTS